MVIKNGTLGPDWADFVAARNRREDEAVARRFVRKVNPRFYDPIMTDLWDEDCE